jgi:hydroxymethylbilane synthase
LRKLDEGLYDAILLAGAGLTRLGLRDRVTEWLPTAICLPAPGQGILGVQVRDGDDVTCAIVASLSSDDSRVCALAERAALESLGGGCRTPAAFLATLDGDRCTVEGVIVHPSGQPYYRDRVSGRKSEAAALGQRLGDTLLADGAAAIIA